MCLITGQYKSIFNLSRLFAVILLIALLGNSFELSKEIETTRQSRKKMPFIFQGFLFSGLEKFIPGVRYVGYFTDKDLDNSSDAARFAQAQYMLAPIVLDLDYQKHEWIIFDFTSEQKAFEAMKAIGASPVKRNNFGIILARQAPATPEKKLKWK